MNGGIFGFPGGPSFDGMGIAVLTDPTGVWTPPPDMDGDVVWLTGCGAGGGAVGAVGGGGGEAVWQMPIRILPGENIPYTIGQPVVAGDGGSTTFGSYLTLLGGASGGNYGLGGGMTSYVTNGPALGIFPSAVPSADTASYPARTPGLLDAGCPAPGIYPGGNGGQTKGSCVSTFGAGSLAPGGPPAAGAVGNAGGGGSLGPGASGGSSCRSYGGGSGGGSSRTGGKGVLFVVYRRKVQS